MKRLNKILSLFMTLVLFLSLMITPTFAYGYKVTLYTGNKGTIQGNTSLDVQVEKGQQISFDLTKIELQKESPYYIKGIRLSGHDSIDTLAPTTFDVEADQEYVVVYGVKGQQVAYTIRYVDKQGNELLPQETFYGNVGDKPVVAYKYVEGYLPQTTAFTKTLSDNEKDNVFTFVYNNVSDNTTTATTTNIVTTVITSSSSTNRTNSRNNTTTNNTKRNNSNQDNETTESSNDSQDVVDLDDEQVPQGNIKASEKTDAKPLYTGITLSALSLAALVLLGLFIRKKRV